MRGPGVGEATAEARTLTGSSSPSRLRRRSSMRPVSARPRITRWCSSLSASRSSGLDEHVEARRDVPGQAPGQLEQ